MRNTYKVQLYRNRPAVFHFVGCGRTTTHNAGPLFGSVEDAIQYINSHDPAAMVVVTHEARVA